MRALPLVCYTQPHADKVEIPTKPAFAECRKRPAFLSNEEIQEYTDRGFVNFKLVGRGLPAEFVRDSYLHFLVKDEARAFVRERIDTFLKDVAKKMKK